MVEINNSISETAVISQGAEMPFAIKEFSIIDSSGNKECQMIPYHDDEYYYRVVCRVKVISNAVNTTINPGFLADSISLLNFVTGESLAAYYNYIVRSVIFGPTIYGATDGQIVVIDIFRNTPSQKAPSVAIGAKLSFEKGPESVIWYGTGSLSDAIHIRS